MRFIVAILLPIFLNINTNAQVDLDLIPPDLLVDANSIILESHEKYTIHSIYKTTFHHKSTTAILKNITHEILLRYNKLSKYESASIVVKDEQGKKVHSIKMNKMDDVALSSDNTILSDDRALIYKIPYGITPYTVELEYVLNSQQTFNLQTYFPVRYYKQSILRSSFEIVNFETSNKLSFNDFYFGKPKETFNDRSTIYNYELRNLSVSALYRSFESKKPSFAWAKLEKFQMEGYVGEYTSWANFGIWLESLMEGADLLSEAAKKEIRSLYKPTDSKIEKIQKLYTYLQNNMRYISIQLGVGGYKPFPAQYVHDNKYGDCKALSHYMKILLELAEIPSYYTVIFAGEEPPKVRQDSVANAFNHAVIVIPLESDTIFLECTSSSSPMAFAGSSLGNRKAFIIDGENSRLINTTYYSHEDNRIITNFDINIDKEFNTSVLKNQTLTGSGADLYHYFAFRNESEEKFKQLLQKFTSHVMSDLVIIDRKQVDKLKYPEFSYSINFKSPEKVTKFGNRLQVFLDYDPLPSDLQTTFKSTSETLEIRFGYTIRDTIQISHPGNCFLEKSVPNSDNQSARLFLLY